MFANTTNKFDLFCSEKKAAEHLDQIHFNTFLTLTSVDWDFYKKSVNALLTFRIQYVVGKKKTVTGFKSAAFLNCLIKESFFLFVPNIKGFVPVSKNRPHTAEYLLRGQDCVLQPTCDAAISGAQSYE